MNLLSVFCISFTVALSGALMPGPLLTTVIAESTRRGFRSGPYICIGHALLEVCMVGLIIAGLSQVARLGPAVLIISLAGAVILFSFGVRMLATAGRLSLADQDAQAPSTNLILLGITVSLSNPYWTMWWLTIGAGLLLASHRQGWLALLMFFLGHISADFAWYSAVAWGFARGARIMSDRVYQGIIVLCGVTLIGFGVYFGVTALRGSL